MWFKIAILAQASSGHSHNNGCESSFLLLLFYNKWFVPTWWRHAWSRIHWAIPVPVNKRETRPFKGSEVLCWRWPQSHMNKEWSLKRQADLASIRLAFMSGAAAATASPPPTSNMEQMRIATPPPQTTTKRWVLMIAEMRRFQQMSYKSDIIVLSGKSISVYLYQSHYWWFWQFAIGLPKLSCQLLHSTDQLNYF